MYGRDHIEAQQLSALQIAIREAWDLCDREAVAALLNDEARHASDALSGDTDWVGKGKHSLL